MKRQPFEFNLFGELTYLIWDTSTMIGAVIDPGMCNSVEQEQFSQFISDRGIKLNYLLYTHLHIDHTLGHEFIVEKYHPIVMAHTLDRPLGLARAEQAQMFRLRIPRPLPIESDKTVDDGQIITIGDSKLEAIYVPGHSPGSIAYYCRDSEFVLTGDALFNGSIGRTDLPGGNHQQLLSSIKQKLFSLPDKTIVYPGHGPATTIGREKLQNPYF